ncbi:pentraxin-related protein PTX3-like [Pristis pectinata]|uniref:pentraxin-related protein PTX3-like n=1 Tax=Pristis pectinata TaxID=685728 RepID=UPI00223DA62A|nr:pentraxin-related protein PTX3-like [Pristis pectinata]
MAVFTKILWILLNLSYIVANDYEDVQVINGMENKISVLPDGSCKCQKELSKWDKLFVMLENAQMKQNILQQSIHEVCKVEFQRIQSEMLQVTTNIADTTTKAIDNAILHITAHTDKKLSYNIEEFSKSKLENESEQKNTLQQLLSVTQDLSNRLRKLETTWQKITFMKDQSSSQDINKTVSINLETILNSFELYQPRGEVTVSEKCSAKHMVPSDYDMALIFPMRSKKIFASVHPDNMILSSFTASIWVKVTDLMEKTIVFSYGTKRNPFEIQLYFNHTSALLSVHNNTSLVIAENVVSPGHWVHFCGTWNNEDGNATLWVNGKLAAGSSGLAVGYVIPDRGILQLGQEKNGCCIRNGFDQNLAFSGKLTGFNIWDRILSEHEIQNLASQEYSHSMRGNVVGWSVTEILVYGGAEFIYY